MLITLPEWGMRPRPNMTTALIDEVRSNEKYADTTDQDARPFEWFVLVLVTLGNPSRLILVTGSTTDSRGAFQAVFALVCDLSLTGQGVRGWPR